MSARCPSPSHSRWIRRNRGEWRPLVVTAPRLCGPWTLTMRSGFELWPLCTGASLGGAGRTARLGWSFISSLQWSHSTVMLTFFKSQVSTVPPGGVLFVYRQTCVQSLGLEGTFSVCPVWTWQWPVGLRTSESDFVFLFFAIILKSCFPSSIVKILNILWMQGKFKDELLNIVTQIK